MSKALRLSVWQTEVETHALLTDNRKEKLSDKKEREELTNEELSRERKRSREKEKSKET
jgi:hypothetical protein